MEVGAAFDLISRAIDAGRAAHGYLVTGDIRGSCAELVDLILRKLFPEEQGLAASGEHPDVVRLEPQGRSRTIKVERGKEDTGPGMRDGLIGPMSATSFSGGWKVGIVAGADRMQPAAANAFLKSLEEPGPQTLYLLLTDQPDLVLPTVVSRTQRVDLPATPGLLDGEALASARKAFYGKDAPRLAAVLAGLKDDAEDADVPLVRKSFYRTLMSFVREIMLSGGLPRHQAFRNVDAVEEAYRQSEKAIGDEAVLSLMLDRMVLP
ncbi:MAG: hypothetical protein J6T51_00095 [Kiritimatiellae bacterium]|nr:hypothetical protein [Kiritimatiellia bacterium]